MRASTWMVLTLLISPTAVCAGEPIRLLVIPYQAGWGSQRIPINQFSGPAMPPPPLPPLPLSPQQAERLKPTGVESDSSDDAVDDEWLMDG